MEAIAMIAREARGGNARGKERSRGRAGGERRTSAGRRQEHHAKQATKRKRERVKVRLRTRELTQARAEPTIPRALRA